MAKTQEAKKGEETQTTCPSCGGKREPYQKDLYPPIYTCSECRYEWQPPPAATHIVHWATGPVYTCEEHARQLVSLGKFLGSHTVCSLAERGHACVTCNHEAKGTG